MIRIEMCLLSFHCAFMSLQLYPVFIVLYIFHQLTCKVFPSPFRTDWQAVIRCKSYLNANPRNRVSLLSPDLTGATKNFVFTFPFKETLFIVSMTGQEGYERNQRIQIRHASNSAPFLSIFRTVFFTCCKVKSGYSCKYEPLQGSPRRENYLSAFASSFQQSLEESVFPLAGNWRKLNFLHGLLRQTNNLFPCQCQQIFHLEGSRKGSGGSTVKSTLHLLHAPQHFPFHAEIECITENLKIIFEYMNYLQGCVSRRKWRKLFMLMLNEGTLLSS